MTKQKPQHRRNSFGKKINLSSTFLNDQTGNVNENPFEKKKKKIFSYIQNIN